MRKRILISLCAIVALVTVKVEAGEDVIHRMKINPRPEVPHTSFQTALGYSPRHDIRTDAAIVFSDLEDRIRSWKDRDYVVQTMYGFRTYQDYIDQYPEEGQAMASGEILTCGPGSYYMVPTQRRIEAALRYFRNAIDHGTTAVIPEEPEYFTQTGYSESFKQEWQDYYGEPWQDQTTSVEARWKSGKLKGYLQHRMVKAIMEDAKAYNPEVMRMVAAHSPVSLYHWCIIYPHYDTMMLPELQEKIGQVWTGTARSPAKYEGIIAERTFEYGLLEYSSLYNLMRGTGKRLWFLMDPLEDHPDRTMDDYQTNYEKTLIASLMFPEIDSFEVMPWPNRIFGRVPGEFATKIMTIVTMLGDIHKQQDSHLDTGTQGIATLVADSMAWQRGEPYPSDYDGFHGLTLPLVIKGIPIQVAQLERTPEPGYLDPYNVLLLSYDMLKPMDEAYNNALADWVRDGGTLILFGGTDAYNDVPEWWRTEGFRSPKEHLLTQLGLEVRGTESLIAATQFDVLGSEDQPFRALENRGRHTFDLSDYIRDGQVFVKIEDSFKDDGWGPSVFSARLKVDGRTVRWLTAGTATERRHIFTDGGSLFNGMVRFADRDAYWIYRFEAPQGSEVELILDMGNQFTVSAATATLTAEHSFCHVEGMPSLSGYFRFGVLTSYPITAYDVDASRLYSVEETAFSPFFEAAIGDGHLIFVGIAPGYFASSEESADLLRSIVRHGCERAGVEYREQHYLKVRRGRYVAARAFDKPFEIEGEFVDVLDPGLRLVTNPVIPDGGLAVLADAREMLSDSKPRYVLSSSRLEASLEEDSLTALLLSGPLDTKGVVRISTAGKRVKTITVKDTSGEPVAFEQRIEDGTLAITHDGLPDGVLVKVEWGN